MNRTIAALSLALIAPACGGGGGSSNSGGGGTGTAPAPSPAPAPAPGGLASTGEVKPAAGSIVISATLELTSAGPVSNELTGKTLGGTTSNRVATLDTPGFALSYSAATGYGLSDTANATTFGAAQLQSDTTSANTDSPALLLTRVSSPVEDYLALYRKSFTTSSSLGSGTITNRIGGNGAWQHSVSGSDGRRTRLDYFAYGSPTPASAMPRSGVVKFSLFGYGNYAGDRDLWFISHLDTLTVDFGASTIAASIGAVGTNFFNGNFGGIFSTRLEGRIEGNSVSGPTSSDIAVATGQFRLQFIGPNADEVIVTYVGQNGRGSYVGSSVGVRNPYLH